MTKIQNFLSPILASKNPRQTKKLDNFQVSNLTFDFLQFLASQKKSTPVFGRLAYLSFYFPGTLMTPKSGVPQQGFASGLDAITDFGTLAVAGGFL